MKELAERYPLTWLLKGLPCKVIKVRVFTQNRRSTAMNRYFSISATRMSLEKNSRDTLKKQSSNILPYGQNFTSLKDLHGTQRFFRRLKKSGHLDINCYNVDADYRRYKWTSLYRILMK